MAERAVVRGAGGDRRPAAAAVLAGPVVHRRHPGARGSGVRLLPGGVRGRRRGGPGQPEPDAQERYRFTFPRQQRGRFLCIADFIRSRKLATERGQVDVLPFQLVTMGRPIADFANELFAANAYRDYLEVHGIGVQLTEALAEYWHKRIREELKFSGDRAVAADDPESVEDYFKLEYRGARFAFGYGACPNLEDRAKMMELLDPGRIGVTLSEELQLHPEQSTDAFVLHHPRPSTSTCSRSRSPPFIPTAPVDLTSVESGVTVTRTGSVAGGDAA